MTPEDVFLDQVSIGIGRLLAVIAIVQILPFVLLFRIFGISLIGRIREALGQ